MDIRPPDSQTNSQKDRQTSRQSTEIQINRQTSKQEDNECLLQDWTDRHKEIRRIDEQTDRRTYGNTAAQMYKLYSFSG